MFRKIQELSQRFMVPHYTNQLLNAIEDQNIKKVRHYLQLGANINGHSGYIPLIIACQNKNLEIIRLLIEFKADLNVVDKDEVSPLSISVLSRDLLSVYYLLKAGADANLGKDRSPLHHAVDNDYIEIAEMLLKNKADPNKKGKDQVTPLMLSHNSLITASLLENGADLHAKDIEGNTALTYSLCNYDMRNAKFLIQKGADINGKDIHGNTLLMKFCGDIQIIDFLLEMNVDVNAKNNAGCTALMIAIEKGNIVTAKEILAKNPDIYIKNNEGHNIIYILQAKLFDLENQIKKIKNDKEETPLQRQYRITKLESLHRSTGILMKSVLNIRSRDNYIGELRKTSRLLYQGWQDKNCVLHNVPPEILKDISVFATAENNIAHFFNDEKTTAMKHLFFKRPPIHTNEIEAESKQISVWKTKPTN